MSLFLGWLPDADTQAALASLQEGIRMALPADAPGHDWRTSAQWHMTLRHLGESLDDDRRARIDAALRALACEASAADASLVGAQYWPPARVLVAKVDASGPLKVLLKQLESTMQACGFAKEPAQTAHFTLAYLPRGARPPALPELSFAPVPLRIDCLHLLRTVPGGYASLASWRLPPEADEA